MSDELVDEGLVERVRVEDLLRPQLYDFDVLDARQVIPMVSQLGALVLRKRLGNFLSILREPVPLTVSPLELEFLLNYLVYLLFLMRFKFADQLFEIFESLHMDQSIFILQSDLLYTMV